MLQRFITTQLIINKLYLIKLLNINIIITKNEEISNCSGGSNEHLSPNKKTPPIHSKACIAKSQEKYYKVYFLYVENVAYIN